MSESDSDLEFESADEDTNCDVNVKNNNAIQERLLTEEVNKIDKLVSVDSPEVKSCASEALKKDSCTDVMGKQLENLDNEQIVKTHDIDNNVSETMPSIENDCSESELSKNILSSKCVEVNITENNSIKETVKAEVTENKVHQERQRVTLRLEKKIQQKHMVKDNSVEVDTSANNSEKSDKVQEQKSSWGFGNWGTSLLSTAASSVSTFTNQVSHGIGTVLETVENTLGAPPPEELATTLSNREDSDDSPVDKLTEKECVTEAEDVTVKSSILPDVSSWTKVLENTGSKVLMGGLDTLELIGKKTIDIITEGDPGLRKKRAVFSDGITLSQILREAKAEADESKQDQDSGVETVHYSQMFDEYQGLVHLEALEMLSKQSEMKIQRLLIRLARNAEVRKNMEEIKSICENIPSLDDPTDCGDFEDFVTVCKKFILELNLTFNVENIIKVQKRITDVLKSYENATATISTPEEIYHSAICSLAEFTARCIEAFHKLAELILVQPTLEPNVEHFATNLTGLTTVMCIEINNLSSRYHHCLESISEQYESGSSEKANITIVVTNLYLEAGNSNKYIQDAFLLLVPVLQVSLLESSQ